MTSQARKPYPWEGEQYTRRLIGLRKELICLRDSCLGPERFDANGAVLLSHAVAWLAAELKGEKYVSSED